MALYSQNSLNYSIYKQPSSVAFCLMQGSCQVLQKVKQVKSNLANRQESHEDNPVEHEVEICNDESQSPKWSHSHISTQKAVDVSDKEIIDKTDVPLVMPHTNSEMTIIPKSAATKPSKSSSKTKSVFIQLDTLKPRDTFVRPYSIQSTNKRL